MIVEALLIIFCCCLLVYIIVALMQTGSFEIVEMDYYNEKIAKQLNGYRIAFLTDMHLYKHTKRSQLQRVVESVNAKNVDLLLLGGDFGPEYKECLSRISLIKAKDGTYAVKGNHDNEDVPDIIADSKESGIHFLNNDGALIKDNLFVAGIDDIQSNDYNVEKAVEKAKENDFVLLLSHNPDIIGEVEPNSADLILSGHTHGGQITIFGLYAPVTSSRYGNHYRSGFYQQRGKPDLLVSKGLGTIYIHIRAFAMPQVYILTLKAGSIF